MNIKVIRAIKALNNSSILMHDEILSLKNVTKDGLSAVTQATKELNPDYNSKMADVGGWRNVPVYNENDYRPLVENDTDKLLKKLNVI